MQNAYLILTWVTVFMTFIPLVKSPHWFFRIFDFGKIQIFSIQALLVAFTTFIPFSSVFAYFSSIILFGSTVYNGVILFKYTPLFSTDRRKKTPLASQPISIISTNVFQDNTQYERFMNLIETVKPEMVLTMESDSKWDKALEKLDSAYPYSVKIPLDNTYGMHLFSNLKIVDSKKHFFVADDLPSIEAEIETPDGYSFKLYTLHPPPPSPTEEDNSKERDGDLLSVAKQIRKDKHKPTVAIGDFNCVAWAEASRLFTKTSEMVDPRLGRGFVSTFHAKYKLLRFPIDQVYHTANIFVEELKTLENVGSDHLPLYFSFVIDKANKSQENLKEKATKEELKEVDEKIEEGKEENGNR
jgi:endonuclease/exonuclease/phosphatase (EEP) superfamily protein YafD